MLINDDSISLKDDLGTISMDDEDFPKSNIEDMESDPEARRAVRPDPPITRIIWEAEKGLLC